MALMAKLLIASLVGLAAGMELTPETWDDAVAGKTVFIKFLAPWWGHCKKMKPDWDKLTAEFADSKTALVADVDCTTGGKALCEKFGVRGYPSIKYGDPDDLQDFEGGRTFDALQKFAQENLKPMCNPKNIDLCDAEKKTKLEELMAMKPADLESKIKEGEEAIKKIESDFKEAVEKLQKNYKELSEKKDSDVKAQKDSGLGMMKSVLSHVKKDGKGATAEL